MIFGYPLLSVAIWLPIIFGLLVLATGNDRNAKLARIIALVGCGSELSGDDSAVYRLRPHDQRHAVRGE